MQKQESAGTTSLHTLQSDQIKISYELYKNVNL